MHVRSLCVVCSSWSISNLTKLRYHRCAFTQQKLPLSLFLSPSFSLSLFSPPLPSLFLSLSLSFPPSFVSVFLRSFFSGYFSFCPLAFQIRPLVCLSVALSVCLSQCVSLPLYFSLSVCLPVLSLPACLYLSISVYLFSSWFLCLFLSLCRTLTM